MAREVVVVAAYRSAIGKFMGGLSSLSAVEMGSQLLSQLLETINLSKDTVDHVIIGNVLSGGAGQNIARQIALTAGLSETTTAETLNQVCGSGMLALIHAAQMIQLGDCEVVVAGGVESMSNAPYVLSRQQRKLGNLNLMDTLLRDGLTDALSGEHMGLTAEYIAEQYHLTREDQDAFALESQRRAQQAMTIGRFDDEILPLTVTDRSHQTRSITQDEFPRFNSTMEGLARLKPAFKMNGTVTAGNSSGINDGAALLLMMTREKAEAQNLPVLATVKSYASAGVSPDVMGLGPIPASQKALSKANLTVDDLDLIEGNEAFAAQSLAVIQELQLPLDKTNVNGGAIALGHPIGASGARIVVTLVHEMLKRQSRYGLATLCIGGGQGDALVLERG
ncbi:MAG: acetyl-CoA C-acetyltransferase [Aerococcus sp.]|nr:acetyl-CoA C-acetyltransferase [Aerococcus sp.]